MGNLPCKAKEILCGDQAIACTQQGLDLINFAHDNGIEIPEEDSYFVIDRYDRMEALADEANQRLLKAIGWNQADFDQWRKNHQGSLKATP